MEFSASVGFIHKESVTMHGHTMVKLYYNITKRIFSVHVRKVTELSLCFTKGKLIIALDEPTEAIRLFG